MAESDKGDDRMRNLALAHKKVVLARLTELCADAGVADAGATAHALGLVIDGAIVAALVTRDPAVAENAGRACGTILASARG